MQMMRSLYAPLERRRREKRAAHGLSVAAALATAALATAALATAALATAALATATAASALARRRRGWPASPPARASAARSVAASGPRHLHDRYHRQVVVVGPPIEFKRHARRAYSAPA